ncbi:MAG: protoporphyrinogen oxidase, partial [Actinobacteria bacterium]|nr:protoporphyrinogen oxidase [Actinomycetota bacterium]
MAVTLVVTATYRLGMDTQGLKQGLRRLVVIGSGIAGLAAAREARLAAERAGLALEVVLVEASDRLGGKLFTERLPAGGVLEWGPDSFLAIKPRGVGLAQELGLGDQLVAPGPMGRSAYLWLKGRLRRMPAGMAMGVPTGIAPLFTAVGDGIIGPFGAARAAIEPLLPRYRGPEDPTAAAVARYRLGRQVAERLVSPLVAGVFGVPYDEVSLRSALPQLADARSWVLTMAKRPAPSGAPIFQALDGGMLSFIEAITAELPASAIRTGYPVTHLRRNADGYVINDDLVADAVVVATPAHATTSILREVAPETSSALSGIDYHASAVILMRYKPGDIGQPLDASGFLVAPKEGRAVAASSWLNAKWPHNGFEDVWIRAIVTDNEHLSAPDEALRRRAAAEMNEMMKASRSPEEVRMERWPDALPIYAPGHQKRVRLAIESLPAGLALAGAAYR